MKHKLLFALIAFTLAKTGFSQSTAAYNEEIAAWDKQRATNLKAETGWLNLVGLHWIYDGVNTFGSDSLNNIVFPPHTIKGTAGIFERKGNRVTMTLVKGLNVSINDKQVGEAVVFDADSSIAQLVAYGDLRWTIIKREDKIGIRLRDLKSPNVDHFKGINRYEPDTNWIIKAQLINKKEITTIPIKNRIGQLVQEKHAGKLHFTIKGKPYTLDAIDEDGELFVIFSDSTSLSTTYPSGRFLMAKNPGNMGFTTLDFNKSYNPPCAFTDYATCPIPPAQNRIPLMITAGEKKYGEH